MNLKRNKRKDATITVNGRLIILPKHDANVMDALETLVVNHITPTVLQISEQMEKNGATLGDIKIYVILERLFKYKIVTRDEKEVVIKNHPLKRVTWGIPEEVLEAMKKSRENPVQ